jgi:hypothetical protein
LIDTTNDPVRLAFVHVFQKRAAMKRDDGKPGVDKFETTAIIQPGGENEKRLNEAIVAVAKEKFGEKAVKDGDGTVPNYKLVLRGLDEDRRGLRDGNLKRTPGGDIYAGFEGMKYITARNTKRPTVVDRDRTVLTEEDGRPYAGCYGTVHIDVWALKKQGVKPCIVADLTGVQFTRDGDAFGSGSAPAAPDDFDDLGAGDEDGGADHGSAAAENDDPFA